MKRLSMLFVPLLLIAVSIVYAIDAREIIENVQERYEDINDAVIEFSQSVRFKVSRAEQSIEGTLHFKKPKKYRIETAERTIVTDGTTSWSWNPSNQQLVVDNYKEETHALSPEQLLLTYPKDYYSTLVGEEQLAGKSMYVLKLTPKEDNAFATAMKIWVSKDWLIRKVEITDVNGAVTTYMIKKITVDQDIADVKFAYQVPDNAEVIDLR
ncbi:MAG: outer membrane lipoprotein carrier protein LolA [Ignavibacteria bacterium]|nr:MAG: outer membrane lipoprotein carrier protein LolA [Ignavibacteria bacterium]